MGISAAVLAGLQSANQGFQLADNLLQHHWLTHSPGEERTQRAEQYRNDFIKALAAQDVDGANAARDGMYQLLHEALASALASR